MSYKCKLDLTMFRSKTKRKSNSMRHTEYHDYSDIRPKNKKTIRREFSIFVIVKKTI